MPRPRLTLLVTALLLPAALQAAPGWDWGFIASRHEDVHGDRCFKAAGPFFQRAASDNGWRMTAVRPLYSSARDPANDRYLRDYLWPAATQRRLKDDGRSRYLIFFHYNHEMNRPSPRYRFWLLPLYFQGRDAKGMSYRAVFPLGGSIHEFLGRDEIDFVLFPIRSTSRLNDLETSNWLWPLISRTEGDKVHRHRFFPFYGRSELDGKYAKRFVLWPIWNDVTYRYPGSSGRGYILFPLWGRMKLDDQSTWWLLPPFFRYTQGEKMDVLYAPWPFFQKKSGEDEERLYLWPVWGHKKTKQLDRHFFLWPIGWLDEIDRGSRVANRFQIAPFYVSTRVARKPAGDGEKAVVEARYRKLWPLASYRSEGDVSRFKTLELWPFSESAAVERNWAPVWTLYRSDRAGERRQSELLWGLYRHHRDGTESRFVSVFPLFSWTRDDADAGRREWSLLKGLLARERDDFHTRWRLLYFLSIRSEREKPP